MRKNNKSTGSLKIKYSNDCNSTPSKINNMTQSQSNFTNVSVDQTEDHNSSYAKNKSMKRCKNIDQDFIKNSLQDIKMNVKDCGIKTTIGYYDL